MKTIRNERETDERFTTYRSLRIVDGEKFGLRLCVTNRERRHQRHIVARRLKDARAELRRYMADFFAKQSPQETRDASVPR